MLLAVRSGDGLVGDATMRAWLELGCCHHMELGALDGGMARDLINLVARRGRLPAECVQYVIEHCGGNALSIEQMVSALVDSNLLYLSDDGTYEVEGELETLALPTTLEDSIRLRLLAVHEREPALGRLLKVAAVLGSGFTDAVAARVWSALGEGEAGGTPTALGDVLARGLQLRLLKLSNGGGTALRSGSRRGSTAVNVERHWCFSRMLNTGGP